MKILDTYRIRYNYISINNKAETIFTKEKILKKFPNKNFFSNKFSLF